MTTRNDPTRAAFARLEAALAEARANGDTAQIAKAQAILDEATLVALRGRLAKAATPDAPEDARTIPGTRTIQSPAPDDEDEDDPDEVDAALQAAHADLAEANGAGLPASVAKAQRALDAATLAAIRSRLAGRTKGTRR